MGLAERPVAFRNLRGINIPFGHVRDLCAAALFLSEYPAADGEAYNVTDDGRLDAIALARLVADEMGKRAVILPPMPIRATRRVLLRAAKISMARARKKGVRPLLEYDQMQYFGHDFLYSNEKLKRTGFEMRWPLPEEGLRAALRWYIDRGWIDKPVRARG